MEISYSMGRAQRYKDRQTSHEKVKAEGSQQVSKEVNIALVIYRKMQGWRELPLQPDPGRFRTNRRKSYFTW